MPGKDGPSPSIKIGTLKPNWEMLLQIREICFLLCRGRYEGLGLAMRSAIVGPIVLSSCWTCSWNDGTGDSRVCDFVITGSLV